MFSGVKKETSSVTWANINRDKAIWTKFRCFSWLSTKQLSKSLFQIFNEPNLYISYSITDANLNFMKTNITEIAFSDNHKTVIASWGFSYN